MAKNPMTYSDALAAVLALDLNNDDLRVTLEALKASIDKKNAADRKPSKSQEANNGFKAEILAIMQDGVIRTVTDISRAAPSLVDASNQKVSALVRQLVEEGSLVRIEEKRKAYFKIAA